MDPITFTLIGLGLVALVTIVTYFLVVENAENYKKEVENSKKKLEKLEQELKRQQQRYEQQERDTEELRENLRNQDEVKKKKESLNTEFGIASSIVEIVKNIVSGNIIDLPSSLLKLVENFYQSFILREHFRDPKNAQNAVRKDTDEFIKNYRKKL